MWFNRTIHHQLKRNVSTLTIFSHPPPNLSLKQLNSLSTSELLNKLGYISQPNAGLTHWLPLGEETLNNVSKIIHKHHKDSGCVEVSLSSLSHSSLWAKTNRWNNNELFKVGDFCLAATAEEEITSLVTPYLNSYKKLPFIGYQLTRKYRNEKRSRGGLLRGREFYMKDAYSFDSNIENALKSFNKMNEIYEKIFNDLRLPWVKANADSGDMGGDLSYEWHIVNDVGEDTVVKCDNCGTCGNVEKIRSFKKEEFVNESDVSYYLNDEKELICVYYPKGRKLSLKFLKEEDLVDINEHLGDGEKALKIFDDANKENDNLKTIYRLIDVNVGPGTKMPDLPVLFSKNHMITFQELDITESQDGDICSNCETGHYIEMRGVEVGHTFYLGKKYSEPLDATFIDKDDQKKAFEMGCYGIGVSRIVGVIAEILRDEQGLRWPANIAPLHVSIIKSSNENQIENNGLFESFINKLQANNIKLEIDDSEDIGFGKKLTKSKMLGIPLQVIIGKLYPLVEIEVRGVYFSENFRELHESKKGEWNWAIEKTKFGAEKHIIDIEYADKVVEALLKDM
jgi:prolyl-tRNA synthetase